MQSNETEREVFVWPDIFRAIGPGDDMVVSAEKLREWLDEREHRKTLQARIDELEQVWAQTKPAVPINTWIFYRLEDLKSQLSKKERTE